MELQQRPEWATIFLLQMQPLAWLEKSSGLPGCSWSALVFSHEPASPEWRLHVHSKDGSSASSPTSLLRLLNLEWSLSPIPGVSNVYPVFSQPPGFLTLNVLMLSYESYFHQALGVVVLSCLRISHVLWWDFLPKCGTSVFHCSHVHYATWVASAFVFVSVPKQPGYSSGMSGLQNHPCKKGEGLAGQPSFCIREGKRKGDGEENTLRVLG